MLYSKLFQQTDRLLRVYTGLRSLSLRRDLLAPRGWKGNTEDKSSVSLLTYDNAILVVVIVSLAWGWLYG